MVTASTIFGDKVPVDFIRRDEEANNLKQPILVLFNEDNNSHKLQSSRIKFTDDEEEELGGKRAHKESTMNAEASMVQSEINDDNDDDYGDEEGEQERRYERNVDYVLDRGQPEVLPEIPYNNASMYFLRQKKGRKINEGKSFQRKHGFTGIIFIYLFINFKKKKNVPMLIGS